MRKPIIYRAVWCPNPVNDGSGAWGIKGGWKTVNSTMGFYRTQAEAEAAIRGMRWSRIVVKRVKVPHGR